MTDKTPPPSEFVELAKSLSDLSQVLVAGKRRENNWLTFKRAGITAIFIALVLFYIVFYARQLGYQSDPIVDAVAIVPIRGPIGQGMDASAENIVPILHRACASPRVHTVVLEISSGGGTPSESERIIDAIKACKQGDAENDIAPKPVIALIDGVGASAAYMISLHADSIYAGRYSLVGSIGAIVRWQDISSLANEHGVFERAFRSAPLKGGASMWVSPSSDESADVQQMVSSLAQVFFDEVKEKRGSKITLDDATLFSGRVWSAQVSLDHGIIDGIATLESLQATQFKGMKIHRYRTDPTIIESMGLAQAVRQAVAEFREPVIQ